MASSTTNPSDAQVDPTESSLGISTYLSPGAPGFSAVSKARFSDFLVHEVAVDGTVARLDSLDPAIQTDGVPAAASSATKEPPAVAAGRKRKEPPGEEGITDWPGIQSELTEIVGEEEASRTVQFLQQEPDQSNKFVRLAPLAEKDKRRSLHEWIRSRLDSIALADTDEGAVRIWHQQFEKDMPNYGKFSRNPRQKLTDKKFLRFVLYKENMDTAVAIGQIQRRSAGKKKLRASYAGMKDKRGVTCQFVTVPSSTPVATLSSLNRSGSGGGGHTKSAGVGLIRVGHFSFTNDELKLGTLKGNRFDVVLRNVRPDSSDDRAATRTKLEQAAQSFSRSGFINHFGVQRFGKYHDTHKTGIAIMKGDFEEAVNIIMSPKPDEREQVAKARKAWLDRFQTEGDRAGVESDCARRVVRDFNQFMRNEVDILNSLARYPLDYKRALSCVPRTMRMMFVHALQSYLWNHVATYRIDTLGRNVIVGDLVVSNDKQQPSVVPEVSVVTADDVAAGRYTLEDIVLPLVGPNTKDPENECGKLFDDLLAKEGLTRDMFGKLGFHDDIRCEGDYRKVICHPSDVDYEILEYTDPLQPLLSTDLMKLDGIAVKTADENVEEPLMGLAVGFTLPSSSYATVALRELMKRPTSSEYQGKLDVGKEELEQKPAASS